MPESNKYLVEVSGGNIRIERSIKDNQFYIRPDNKSVKISYYDTEQKKDVVKTGEDVLLKEGMTIKTGDKTDVITVPSFAGPATESKAKDADKSDYYKMGITFINDPRTPVEIKTTLGKSTHAGDFVMRQGRGGIRGTAWDLIGADIKDGKVISTAKLSNREFENAIVPNERKTNLLVYDLGRKGSAQLFPTSGINFYENEDKKPALELGAKDHAINRAKKVVGEYNTNRLGEMQKVVDFYAEKPKQPHFEHQGDPRKVTVKNTVEWIVQEIDARQKKMEELKPLVAANPLPKGKAANNQNPPHPAIQIDIYKNDNIALGNALAFLRSEKDKDQKPVQLTATTRKFWSTFQGIPDDAKKIFKSEESLAFYKDQYRQIKASKQTLEQYFKERTDYAPAAEKWKAKELDMKKEAQKLGIPEDVLKKVTGTKQVKLAMAAEAEIERGESENIPLLNLNPSTTYVRNALERLGVDSNQVRLQTEPVAESTEVDSTIALTRVVTPAQREEKTSQKRGTSSSSIA